mmetsp:Transcript_32960/g.49122  ORF Transcript_32960/g.49122 Transcript_32960/m.49122 type:complete len:89 (+) Transcript_32960:494-760(+)
MLTRQSTNEQITRQKVTTINTNQSLPQKIVHWLMGQRSFHCHRHISIRRGKNDFITLMLYCTLLFLNDLPIAKITNQIGVITLPPRVR